MSVNAPTRFLIFLAVSLAAVAGLVLLVQILQDQLFLIITYALVSLWGIIMLLRKLFPPRVADHALLYPVIVQKKGKSFMMEGIQ